MNRNLLRITAIFLVLGTLGQAQVAPDAAELLNRMRQAHGGAALEQLRTYQETITLTLFSGPQPQARLTVTNSIDVLAQKVQVEYRVGSNLVQAILYTPEGGQIWTAESGRRALEPALADDFKNSFYQSWLGLRFGGTGRELARLEGMRTFGDVRGRAVVVRTRGTQTTYLVDEQNRLVAESYRGSLGDFTAYYDGFRSVSGLLIPFQGRVYVNGVLFAEIQVQEARVNPTLGPETFKLP
ncbi:MAG: hypothetical protein KatS3mg071_0970 [Meiothermus sp.]|nr:MAG: hypothetical protein KatS3mg071_0970 [Meiothermus sp.]